MSRGDDLAVLIVENENDPQEQHRQYPLGHIEELFMLRGEPLPYRINERTHDQYIDTPKANSVGESSDSTGRFWYLYCHHNRILGQ